MQDQTVVILPNQNSPKRPQTADFGVGWPIIGAAIVAFVGWAAYELCLIEVPTGKMAILITKTGIDLKNSDEVAPTEKHKGIQKEVLLEGRHYRNPFFYSWEIISQTEIESDKLGVLVRQHGEELPPGQFLAENDEQKGIVPGIK